MAVHVAKLDEHAGWGHFFSVSEAWGTCFKVTVLRAVLLKLWDWNWISDVADRGINSLVQVLADGGEFRLTLVIWSNSVILL